MESAGTSRSGRGAKHFPKMNTVVRLEQFQPSHAAALHPDMHGDVRDAKHSGDAGGTIALPRSRGGLCAWLKRCAATAGADGYMLLDLAAPSAPRIVASSWSFDAIHALGDGLLARIAAPGVAPFIGSRPALRRMRDGVDHAGTEAVLLRDLGFAELAATRFRIAQETYCLIISASRPGAIDARALRSAKLTACYALSHMADLLTPALPDDPLSERERECLFWVAEGKTTDEVSTIISVSANTVNSYLGCAMRKLAAANRTMAVAAAIRGGII